MQATDNEVERESHTSNVVVVTMETGVARCEHYNTSFQDAASLAHHCTTIHKKTVTYRCPLCGTAKWDSLQGAKIHIGLCKRAQQRALASGDGAHDPPPAGEFKCRHCTRSYQSRSGLDSHMQSIHVVEYQEEYENYKHVCKVCKKRFETQSGLSQHETHIHPEVANKRRSKKGKPGARITVWTPRKVAKLPSLLREYQGSATINARIAAAIGDGITAKQVSNKRREMTKKSKQ